MFRRPSSRAVVAATRSSAASRTSAAIRTDQRHHGAPTSAARRSRWSSHFVSLCRRSRAALAIVGQAPPRCWTWGTPRASAPGAVKLLDQLDILVVGRQGSCRSSRRGRDDRQAAGAAAEALAAAQAIVAAFGANRVDEYFACFHPDATFDLLRTPSVLASRAEYRAESARWVEDGFEVVSCTSSDQCVRVFGTLAVFTHHVSARACGRRPARRRLASARRSVLARDDDGAWLAVHEHVSLAPNS